MTTTPSHGAPSPPQGHLPHYRLNKQRRPSPTVPNAPSLQTIPVLAHPDSAVRRILPYLYSPTVNGFPKTADRHRAATFLFEEATHLPEVAPLGVEIEPRLLPEPFLSEEPELPRLKPLDDSPPRGVMANLGRNRPRRRCLRPELDLIFLAPLDGDLGAPPPSALADEKPPSLLPSFEVDVAGFPSTHSPALTLASPRRNPAVRA